MLEIVIALAMFGLLILILAALEAEMVRFDRSMQLDFFTHPDRSAVITRMRRDVLDTTGYPDPFDEWSQSHTVLILRLSTPPATTVVWDVSESGTARRIEYTGAAKKSAWAAFNVPAFTFDSYDMPDGKTAVRLEGTDSKGEVIVDQVFTPRPK
ncbi:MAG: hypothetical protein WBX15_12745 [Thermoanaerobaculia bacterium]